MKKERFLEEDFEGFIEDLIKSGRLDDKEIGICLIILRKGLTKFGIKAVL